MASPASEASSPHSIWSSYSRFGTSGIGAIAASLLRRFGALAGVRRCRFALEDTFITTPFQLRPEKANRAQHLPIDCHLLAQIFRL
jgi:hypothetical protein